MKPEIRVWIPRIRIIPEPASIQASMRSGTARAALLLLLPAVVAAVMVGQGSRRSSGAAGGAMSAFQSAPSSTFTLRSGQAGSLCQGPALRAPAGPRGTQEGSLTIVSQFRGGRGRGGGGGRGRGRGRGPPVIEKARGPPMNEEIQFAEVRVVLANPEGKDDMLGIMSRDEAIKRSEDEGMDLVLVLLPCTFRLQPCTPPAPPSET